ncbi:MAG: YegP family protein [Gammaproteobacteria bacterium]
MAGWFELSKASDGKFHFVLKAGNAETILTSQLYTAKTSAEGGIAAVRANCQSDDQYEKATASNGKPYFNLKAANGQVIGTSQMYASESARDSGIASVKSNGLSETVKDNS